MATKLKHLKVTSVDFVDEGANPDAHIRLYKRRDEAAAEPGTEDPNSDGAGFFKRLSSSLAKMFGLAQEPESAEAEVQKTRPVSMKPMAKPRNVGSAMRSGMSASR